MMPSKRRPIHLNQQPTLNFRSNISENSKWETKGTKPLPEPSSIGKVLLMMILQLCRRIMFFDTRLKVAIYLSCLFVVSILSQQMPFPRTYFSRRDNIFNVYFVKLAWGWTLSFSLPFVSLTSLTFCCGRKDKVLKHLIRLVIATLSWYFWVTLFLYIGSIVGSCNTTPDALKNKHECLRKGLSWKGFDISGHSFILIYCSLVIIEESRAIIGWEGIEDLIRNEEYSRTSSNKDISSPLRNLTSSDFEIVKDNYKKFTPVIRGLFIAMTGIVILWDSMLLSTMLYFHTTVEKLLGGFIAIFMWFLTYKYFFTLPAHIPEMPGEGMFKYRDSRLTRDITFTKRSKSDDKGQLPKFLGMPLYGLQQNVLQEKNTLPSNNGFELKNQT